MDAERLDDIDYLDLGDVGLPPEEAVEPGPERQPRAPRPAQDPSLPLLTPILVVVMLLFGGLSMSIMTAGGSGGQALAWMLGGAFSVLYVAVFWAGSMLIARHRY